jgi:hypothetical protein
VTLPFTILNVTGPFREPRELVLSYDYAIQRPAWPTPHGVRIKVSIPDELDHCKVKILNVSGGSPGQQLIMNQVLSRRIADRKLEITNDEGLLQQRQDVLVEPFTGSLVHLFPRLDAWMNENRETLREEIRQRVKL